MTLAGDVLFNLMLNAVASFWLGLALSLLIWRFAKPARPSLALLVLLLPLLKLLWDLRAGIPASSFFWASQHGLRQRLGSFQIGLSAHPWGGSIDGRLWAEHAGGRSPQSVADVLSRALRLRVSAYAASLLSFAVLLVSLSKCARRTLGLLAFRARVRAQLLGCSESEWRSLGRRQVRIFTSHGQTDVPFAGGLIRPYVVLPARLSERLSSPEREAVIEHELAHIRYFDLALLLPLEFLGDLCWFVPGLKWRLSKLRSLLEQRADECAVKAGVAPGSLASALLVAAELAAPEGGAPLLAVAREPSTLQVRVRRLLSPEPARRAARWLVLVRGLLLVWLVLGMLQASACGNQP